MLTNDSFLLQGHFQNILQPIIQYDQRYRMISPPSIGVGVVRYVTYKIIF